MPGEPGCASSGVRGASVTCDTTRASRSCLRRRSRRDPGGRGGRRPPWGPGRPACPLGLAPAGPGLLRERPPQSASEGGRLVVLAAIHFNYVSHKKTTCG